jgi:NAD(P)-dependent dehydrogenase (short-subunit alcohol dehydrogenase family)
VNLPLEGLVALVTGAGSGIGAEVAARLAQDGAAVGVNGLTQEEVADTVARITSEGGRAVPVVGDVSDPDDAQRLVREIDEQLGGLHVLVNNAGLQEETPFLELDLETWRKAAVGRPRRRLPHGSCGVPADGAAGRRCRPQRHERARAPAAARLRGLLRRQGRAGDAHQGDRPELADKGIRSVAVAPGAIETPIQGDRSEAEVREQEEGIPAGRLGRPSEVAALISYLVSPAAAYVSGTTVVIDGALEQQVSLS